MQKLIILSILFIMGCTTEPILEGCTTVTACNYNADAEKDDASCTYAEENFDCDGNCVAELDCNEDANLESEALAFALQYLESIVDENYEMFNSSFSIQDSLYFLESWESGLIVTQELIDNLFYSLSGNISDDVTMELFLNNHSPFIKTYEEMNEFALEYWGDDFFPQPYWWGINDFIFFAPVNNNSLEIIWEDILLFVISKSNDSWYIKAFSG